MISKICEMDLGDFLDSDALVTAYFCDGRCEIRRVIMTIGGCRVDMANELTESARERLMEELIYMHDKPTSEPEDIPGVDR